MLCQIDALLVKHDGNTYQEGIVLSTYTSIKPLDIAKYVVETAIAHSIYLNSIVGMSCNLAAFHYKGIL